MLGTDTWRTISIILITILLSFFTLVFGELVPKRLAMKYYEKIIGQKPLAIDYMNAGHVAWAMGDIQKAAALYGKSITANGNRERFLEMFRKDEEALLKQGIQEEDIPLMLDLL